jgi:hypothetical protein
MRLAQRLPSELAIAPELPGRSRFVRPSPLLPIIKVIRRAGQILRSQPASNEETDRVRKLLTYAGIGRCLHHGADIDAYPGELAP